MNTVLLEYINDLEKDVNQISNERKERLGEISDFIREKQRDGNPAKLTFICTHNSRRSHLGRIWSATLAEHFGLEGVDTYSGGTEATAFNPRAVEAIKRAGFTVEDPEGDNPRYRVFYDERQDPLVCYSKTFNDEANPDNNFVAVMTCSDADRHCPIVPGAELRVSIPYDDPKEADGTSREAQVYDQRCRQIAAEMYYMLSRLA